MHKHIAAALRIAQAKTDRSPSDAQKESGNYSKGKLAYKGMTIAIENPKGSERSGTDKGGKRWSVRMPAAYGYVLGTEGKDGDHVDVYLGPDHESDRVFIVDQVNAENGKFDEHKVMLSYPSRSAAMADYQKAFSDGKAKDRIGAVTETSLDAFKSWLKSGNTKKPVGDIRMKRANGGAVTFSRDSVSYSPADDMLKGYADGGMPAPMSEREMRRITQARMAGVDVDPESLDRLAAHEAWQRDVAEPRIMNAVGEMTGANAVKEAYDDPSIPNLTNAGARVAMAAFQPMRALQMLGLGYGAATAKDLGLLPFGSAKAADDGLTDAQRKRLVELQRKGSLSRAEREEKNAIVAMQAEAARITREAEAQAALKKSIYEEETKAAKAKDEQAEYNRAVAGAERARDEELARGKSKRFDQSEVGRVYDKTGVITPFLAAAGLGGLSRAVTGGGTFMKDYGLPAIAGALTGGSMASWPLAHEVLFQPADNPERRAYEAYGRELPPGHPRKQEWTEYARGLPETNPAKELARRDLYDPTQLAERTGLGAIEGLLGGWAGSKIVQLPGRAMEKIPEIPGRISGAYNRGLATGRAAGLDAAEARAIGAGARSDALAAQNDDALEALLAAEGPRRIGAPAGVAGRSEGAARPRPMLSREASSSPPASESPKASPRKSSKKDVSPAQEPRRGKNLPTKDDVRAVEDELSKIMSAGEPTGWARWADEGAPAVLPNAEQVILKTKRKDGGWNYRHEDGRFRGGPVKGRSAAEIGLETARKYASGGSVLVGPVVGATGGREDALPVDVPHGSFVVPADIVSHLGSGNSLAGMDKLNAAFGGAVMPGRAQGGAVPIKISDGEYVISPEQVAKLGGGDMDRGHKVLDQLIIRLRQDHIKTLKSLPGPAKG